MNKFVLVVLLLITLIVSTVVGIVLVFFPQFSPLTGGFTGNQYINQPPAADFTLTMINGTKFKLSDYAGKVIVISFIYSHCPDICPAITSGFAEVGDLLEAEGVLGDAILVLVPVDYPGGYVAAVTSDSLFYLNYSGVAEWSVELDYSPMGVEMSQDAGRIVVWSDDTVYIYDRDGSLLTRFLYPDGISDVFISGAGLFIAVASGNVVDIYIEVAEGLEYSYNKYSSVILDSDVVGLGATTNGTYIYTVTREGFLYRIYKGDVDASISALNQTVVWGDIAYSGSVALLATNDSLYIYNVLSNSLIELPFSPDTVIDYDISQTGDYVALATTEGVYLLNDDGEEVWVRPMSASSVSISGDNYFVSISEGSKVYRLDINGTVQWETSLETDVVFVDVTMERDSPRRLKEWSEIYDAEQTIFLYGSYKTLSRIWSNYGIAVAYVDVDDPATSYLVAHTGMVYIIDKEFKVRIFFIGAPPQWSASDVVNDVMILVKEEVE